MINCSLPRDIVKLLRGLWSGSLLFSAQYRNIEYGTCNKNSPLKKGTTRISEQSGLQSMSIICIAGGRGMNNSQSVYSLHNEKKGFSCPGAHRNSSSSFGRRRFPCRTSGIPKANMRLDSDFRITHGL